MKTPTRITAKREVNVVSSLLVPLQNKNLLVPNVMIAEVVGMQHLQPIGSAPPWALGNVEWRGELIPVISFEIANSQVRGRDTSSARLAIFNTIGNRTRYHFFAVLVQGIPRMMKLTDMEVREDVQASVGEAEKMAVITQLGKAVIPNLDYLESLLAKLV
ncbi:MAG: chemotaxis protein CheW [Reinekea sp.]|jgi:chemosensory pili system protein ChpC